MKNKVEMMVKVYGSPGTKELLTHENKQRIANKCVKLLTKAKVKPGQCLSGMTAAIGNHKIKLGYDLFPDGTAAAFVCLDIEELPIIDPIKHQHEVNDGHYRMSRN